MKGHRKRFASTKVILSHGRGYLPYAATHFAELGASLSKNRQAEDFMADIRSFYYDTALVTDSGLPSLLATIPLDHIVFGTDYPYASEKVCKIFTSNLDHSNDLTREDREAINGTRVSWYSFVAVFARVIATIMPVESKEYGHLLHEQTTGVAAKIPDFNRSVRM